MWTHRHKRGTHRDSDRETQQEPQTQSEAERERQGTPHSLDFSRTLGVDTFIHQLGGHRPAPIPSPAETPQ